ncbi:mCG145243, partial [Mus musculus]
HSLEDRGPPRKWGLTAGGVAFTVSASLCGGEPPSARKRTHARTHSRPPLLNQPYFQRPEDRMGDLKVTPVPSQTTGD